ncbi:MAG: ATP:cob(I)alamin adenosyltransferase [SAR202 cluster bacterium Casp-Chloro-G4]|nr:cob(I)yrinic acid a,c-diamide adenosyltransferase [Chloroflexota bacterium]MDA1227583.1 cob(I)yrinic acid a,c-diamide adenosyltransferase [Chloroflexota bacterium]PKB61010.1 MAG: ATP:cob(I)alamin adenosyltransferase [SAR202 cluster bacterium Casp-Chloro-G4]
MKIYTKSGDDGTTGLLFGGRVSKTDPRCVAYGEADFATSAMGFARALATEPRVQEMILQLQREMFTLSGELATGIENYEKYTSTFEGITSANVDQLEVWIDELGSEVELPPNFIIPGASPTSGALDLARSALRGAERRVVALDQAGQLPNPEILRYVNRLADLLFMMARYVDRDLPMEIVTGTRVKAD